MTTESGAIPNCNFARCARIVDQQEYLGDKQATERGHNERYANSESCYGSWIMCAQPSSLPFTGQRRSLLIPINVGSGYNCGRFTAPLYCYGIPVSIGTGSSGNGTFWLDTYVTGYNAGTGFVLYYSMV